MELRGDKELKKQNKQKTTYIQENPTCRPNASKATVVKTGKQSLLQAKRAWTGALKSSCMFGGCGPRLGCCMECCVLHGTLRHSYQKCTWNPGLRGYHSSPKPVSTMNSLPCSSLLSFVLRQNILLWPPFKLGYQIPNPFKTKLEQLRTYSWTKTWTPHFLGWHCWFGLEIITFNCSDSERKNINK